MVKKTILTVIMILWTVSCSMSNIKTYIEMSMSKAFMKPIDKELENALYDYNNTKIKELIKNGANVDFRDVYGDTLLMKFAYLDEGMTRYLIEHGADVNARGYNGSTALMQAAEYYMLDNVRLLLEKGADINALNDGNWSALTYAVQARNSSGWGDGGYFHVVQYLVERGAYTRSSLKFAKAVGHDKIIEFLEKDAIHKSDENALKFIEFAMNGNLEQVKKILEKGINIDISDKYGYTALMNASYNGHLEIAKYLVENGADVNLRDSSGNTALISTSLSQDSIRGNLEIIQYLVEKGADINAKGSEGLTALMWVSYNGHSEIVKFLIENGADVNIKSNEGKTALDYASTTRTKEELKKAGAK